MMPSRTAYIEGIGIWSAALPSWDEASRILRGEMPPAQDARKRPSPELLPPNERRRAPDTVAVSLEVASKACAHAQREAASLPSVFSSTHGDLAVTDYMAETLAEAPEMISPTKFHNSVHNAAAGYWAIATGSMQPYTALSASHRSFANGLLEALVQAQTDDTGILFVAYDIEAQGPLATVVESSGRLGVALVLNALPSARAKFALKWDTRANDKPGDSKAGTLCASLVAGNAMAGAMTLMELLARSEGSCTYALGPGLELALAVEAVKNRADTAA